MVYGFKGEGGVRYYGKIQECLEYKRKDCTELKARAGIEDDMYLRINIESIEEVDKHSPNSNRN